MTDNFKFSWGDDLEFKKLTLTCLDTQIEFDLISDDEEKMKEKIGGVVLLTGTDFKVFLHDIIPGKNDYRDVDDIKSNIKDLFKKVVPNDVTTQNLFQHANDYYLKKYKVQGDNEAKKFKNLTKLRHSLRKYLVMAHIQIVISTEVTCKYNTRKNILEKDKDDRIALLKALLKDSTNLLLNIDAVPLYNTKLVKEESDDYNLQPPSSIFTSK